MAIELDDNPARIDIAAVRDYLANESYWAKGRPYEVVERLVREAQRVVGVYDEGRQVGFARAFTDGSRSCTSRTSTCSRSTAGVGSECSWSERWSSADRTPSSVGCCTRE